MNRIKFITEEHTKAAARASAVRLLSSLLIGTSLATPATLWASAPSFQSSLNPATQQNTAQGNAQQPLAPRPVQESNGRPVGDRPDKDAKPPKNDGRPDARPPRPRPGTTPRPPHQGAPVHQHPRPPAYPHSYYGPRYPTYAWGPGNGWRLRHFFIGNGRPVNRWHRHHLFVGGYLPVHFLGNMQPVPPSLMFYLPPVPRGYEIGFFDGYCLVYDPYTLRIVSVIDLYQY